MLILIEVDTAYCGMDEEYLYEVPDDWSEAQVAGLAAELAYENAIEKGADDQARYELELGDIEIDEDCEDFDVLVDEFMGVWYHYTACAEEDREALIEKYGAIITI